MAKISLQQVCKSFVHNHRGAQLRRFLHLREREFMVFVGPCYCGKSTLPVAPVRFCYLRRRFVNGGGIANIKHHRRSIKAVFLHCCRLLFGA